jgi:hypothetical protein
MLPPFIFEQPIDSAERSKLTRLGTNLSGQYYCRVSASGFEGSGDHRPPLTCVDRDSLLPSAGWVAAAD